MPRQNRYNLPMEIFYTIAPFIIIAVLFYYTVLAQNAVTAKEPNPEVTIDVVGQKWSWTFNYKAADNPAVGSDVWEAGTINKTLISIFPSASWWSSTSLLGRDSLVLGHIVLREVGRDPWSRVTPQLTPTTEGVFAGKCAELWHLSLGDAFQCASS